MVLKEEEPTIFAWQPTRTTKNTFLLSSSRIMNDPDDDTNDDDDIPFQELMFL
jgi:hypothetical protein